MTENKFLTQIQYGKQEVGHSAQKCRNQGGFA